MYPGSKKVYEHGDQPYMPRNDRNHVASGERMPQDAFAVNLFLAGRDNNGGRRQPVHGFGAQDGGSQDIRDVVMQNLPRPRENIHPAQARNYPVGFRENVRTPPYEKFAIREGSSDDYAAPEERARSQAMAQDVHQPMYSNNTQPKHGGGYGGPMHINARIEHNYQPRIEGYERTPYGWPAIRPVQRMHFHQETRTWYPEYAPGHFDGSIPAFYPGVPPSVYAAFMQNQQAYNPVYGGVPPYLPGNIQPMNGAQPPDFSYRPELPNNRFPAHPMGGGFAHANNAPPMPSEYTNPFWHNSGHGVHTFPPGDVPSVNSAPMMPQMMPQMMHPHEAPHPVIGGVPALYPRMIPPGNMGGPARQIGNVHVEGGGSSGYGKFHPSKMEIRGVDYESPFDKRSAAELKEEIQEYYNKKDVPNIAEHRKPRGGKPVRTVSENKPRDSSPPLSTFPSKYKRMERSPPTDRSNPKTTISAGRKPNAHGRRDVEEKNKDAYRHYGRGTYSGGNQRNREISLEEWQRRGGHDHGADKRRKIQNNPGNGDTGRKQRISEYPENKIALDY